MQPLIHPLTPSSYSALKFNIFKALGDESGRLRVERVKSNKIQQLYELAKNL